MLKLSNYYKNILKNLYNDVIIEYIISYGIDNHANFINFKLLININDMPVTIEELFPHHHKLKDIFNSYDNLKLLIIINNDHKYSTHLKFQFIDNNN